MPQPRKNATGKRASGAKLTRQGPIGDALSMIAGSAEEVPGGGKPGENPGPAFTLDHDGWRSRINLEKVPWLSTYLGSWGTRYWLPLEWVQKAPSSFVSSIPDEVDLPGVSAPRGPKFGDEGNERETWCNPVAFAGIA